MRRVGMVLVLGMLVLAGTTACTPADQVTARGGTGQITVYTDPGAIVALYDARGRLVPTLLLPDSGDPQSVNTRTTDDHGYVVLRYVAEGSGYTVRRIDDANTKPSQPVTVTGLLATPARTLYTSQKLGDGYSYLKTRDGTLLSVMVRLPGPADKGPYPTVIEYSGYGPADPEWETTSASTRIANALGYATVGVNIRGTGCSGGSFQLWEDAQATDGYDVVETIAAQPWVKHHKVGLVGLSYPGNAALYAAATQPPSLAGIAVGGTYDDGFRNLLRPAGILNDGFASGWIRGRYDDAKPAGQEWAKKRIAAGDAICSFNQEARGQTVDLTTRIAVTEHYPTLLGLGDSFAPDTFVDRIEVPVFLVATWQDEQVGGHAPSMIGDFTGTSKKHVVLTNGGHAEMFAVPDILARWDEFLDLYVKREVPAAGVLRDIAPYLGQQVLGTDHQLTSLDFPADRFTGKTYAQALAAYESEPQVRVLYENGAAPGKEPGLPQQSMAADYATWPLPGTTATRWYLGDGGSLAAAAPTAADDATGTIDSYVSDAAARPRTSTTGGHDWAQVPPYRWTDPVAGKSLTYLSPPLAQTTTMAGSASVDLWLRSSAADTDLQATLTEVRPDGTETYVQSGWLRASARHLDAARSTELEPVPTMLEADAAPLPAGQFTPVRLEIYPFAHVFRAGSRIRLILTAPGGDRMAWTFATLAGTPTNEVAHSVGRPSSIALPVVSAPTPPAALPACPSQRAQPCRTYTGPLSTPG